MAECCDTKSAPIAPACPEMLSAAMGSYFQLLTGQAQVVSVVTAGATVTYQPKQIAALRTLIENLHRVCPCAESAAMLGIGRRQLGQMVYGPRAGLFPRCDGC